MKVDGSIPQLEIESLLIIYSLNKIYIYNPFKIKSLNIDETTDLVKQWCSFIFYVYLPMIFLFHLIVLINFVWSWFIGLSMAFFVVLFIGTECEVPSYAFLSTLLKIFCKFHGLLFDIDGVLIIVRSTSCLHKWISFFLADLNLLICLLAFLECSIHARYPNF